MLRACSTILVIATLLLPATSQSAGAATNLTVADARQRALSFNRQYLSAEEDLMKADAQIVQARAGILPTVSAQAGYNRNFMVPTFFIFGTDSVGNKFQQSFKTGSNNNYSASLTVSQPLWEGAKALNAWAIAKLYRKYSEDAYKQAEATVIYTAEVMFYGAILQRANLDVLQKALEANTKNLDVVEKMHAQGMVSQYEVLRARVEKANLLPGILQAESDVRLSEKRLKSFLGIDLNDSLVLIEQVDDTSLTHLLSLSNLVDTALANRPEMKRANSLIEITKRAVRIAKGDYQPSLYANMSYAWQAQSNQFQFDNQSRSWTAGLSLSFPIFSGGQTRGTVAFRKAEQRQATLADEQTSDDIRLEVEEAYDRLIQAKKSLDVQGATIAEAEEGLRIANLRYESGQGTQLEVLSAQTALTDARRALATALNFFRQARAGLKKATTVDIL
jgi:outer membrane protein